jgi:glycosyltransferase involved in cell wall biosynthesis
MDVSVIVPTYNRPALLKQTLDSVLAQSVAPREIILVDNGTGDETRQVVDAAYGSAVTYVKVPPEGVQAARNAGIARAQGTWIATLDDDDLWHRDYLEQVARAAQDGRANLIYSDFRKFNEAGGVREPHARTNFEMAPQGYWDAIPRPEEGAKWSFVGSFPAERLLRFVPFYPSTMTIRRDLVQSIGGFNRDIFGIKSEDMEFTVRALLAGQLAIIWAPLTDYRIHDANSCAADWVSQAIGRWKIFEYIYARDGYGSEAFRRALEEDLPRRRAHMFDQAWRHSRFAAYDEIEPLLRPSDWTWMRCVRFAVRRAPPPLRTAVMHTRQLVSQMGKGPLRQFGHSP